MIQKAKPFLLAVGTGVVAGVIALYVYDKFLNKPKVLAPTTTPVAAASTAGAGS